MYCLMQSIRVVVFSVVIVCMMLPTVLFAEVEQDEKSKEVLNKLSAYVKGLNSLEVDVTLTMKMSAKGTNNEMSSSHSLSMQKPNKLALTLTDGMNGSNVISDGKSLYTHMPITKKYSKEDAPGTMQEMDESILSSLRAIGLPVPGLITHLWSENPTETLIEYSSKVSHDGTEEVDGKTFQKIRMTMDDADLVLWIADGDQPVIHKIVPDMSKITAKYRAQLGSEADGLEMSVNIELTDWKLNNEISAGTFAFTAPEGAELVGSQQELYASLQPDEPASPEEAMIGKTAANFKLELLSGGEYELANEKEKSIVILDFWASWCGPCRQVMPIMESLAKKYKEKGVKVIAVNLRETPAQIKSFLESQGLHATVVLDKDGSIADQYYVSGIPQTVIVGKDGTVQAVHVGSRPDLEQVLSKELETLISGKSLAK